MQAKQSQLPNTDSVRRFKLNVQGIANIVGWAFFFTPTSMDWDWLDATDQYRKPVVRR